MECEDAWRDMDGFDPDEELVRLRRATSRSGRCSLLQGTRPQPGWSIADASVAMPAAVSVFGADTGPRLIQWMVSQGWRFQCAPGSTSAQT